jgi:hypothetical protein
MSSLVFNSYLKQLNSCTGDFYNPNYFDVWLYTKTESFKGKNTPDLIVADPVFEKDYMVYLGNLGNMAVQSVDNAGMYSVSSYQSLFNIPVSAYLFSKQDCPQASYLKNDIEYSSYDYSVTARRMTKPSDGCYIPTATPGIGADWAERSAYFVSEYNFSDSYTGNEYNVFDGPKERLVEKNIAMNTDNVSLSGNIHNNIAGSLLITRYVGQRIYDISADRLRSDPSVWQTCSAEYIATSATPLNPGESIPCMYMELPMTYKLSNAVVNIQWSENGLFTFR